MSDGTGDARRGSGCGRRLGRGCLTALAVLAAGGYLGYLGAVRLARAAAAEYTAPAPAELPVAEMAEAEAAALGARVRAFAAAAREGRATPELVLTARDINALAREDPGWRRLGGRLRVAIAGDALLAEVSVPLDGLRGPLGAPFKGRWLNASGAFRVRTAAGRLLVFADALKVRGEPLPERVMARLRGRNLAENAARNPEAEALLGRLESAEVRHGELRVKLLQPQH